MASSQFPESDNGPKPKSIPGLAVNFPHLAAFLNWTPPTLEKAPGSTVSAGTRAPAHWDMHLKDDLTLKRIVHMPSLPETLVALVDNALSNSSERMLSSLDDWISQRALWRPKSSLVRDERDVVEYYEDTIAHTCVQIASELEFGLTCDQSPLFQWKQSHRHGGQAKTADDLESTDLDIPETANASETIAPKAKKTAKTTVADTPATASAKAIADGFLRVFLDSENFEDDIASLPAYKKDNLRAIRRHFVNLAVWEFKSIVAGDKNTMDAINALIGKPFHWQKCSEETPCQNLFHLEKSGIPKVTRVRTGPDPIETPWTLPGHGSIVDSNLVEQGLTPAVKPCKKRKNNKRTRKPLKAPKQSHEVKARCIIQQAWMEAVQSDTTLVVIQSGNFEFIGIRDRASQTLYLTELVDVPNSASQSDPNSRTRPPYAMVHTGLYIAAIRETVSRALQISDYETRNVPFPYIGDTEDTPDVEAHVAYNRPKEWFMVQPEVTMSVRLYNDDHAHPPTKFFREPISDLDSDIIPFRKFDDPSTTILVTFGQQRMGMVFEAKVGLYGRPLIPRAVVKFAVGRSYWPRLEKEYHICLDLARRGVKGIVSALGLYENEKQGIKVLVMEDGGWPLTGEEGTDATLRTAFKSTLAEIHRAGYLHNDLSSTDLLVSSGGKVTTCIVGFSRCALLEDDDGRRAASESECLEDILNGSDRDDGNSGMKRRRVA